MRHKKVYKDIIFNTVATSLPIVFLQFIVYPVLSREVSVEFFGIILTLVAVKNTLSYTTGNSLNNVRLIRESEKKEFRDKGDYNLILIFSQLITLAASAAIAVIYRDRLVLSDHFILFAVFVLASVRIYATVFYRINLNFKRIAFLSLINASFLGVGLLMHISLIRSWAMIFLVSELASIVFVLKTTPVLSEKQGISKDVKKINKDFIHLMINALLANVMKYLDRFLINPIIGADQVAVYYVAAVISKTAGLVMSPVNSVILSYTAKYKSRLDKKIYFKYLILISILAAAQFLSVWLFSEMLIKMLYPDLYDMAKDYIMIASTGIIIGITANILQPLVISTSDLKYQPRINIVYTVVYLTSALILTQTHGLLGFCYSSVIGYGVKFIMMLYIGYRGVSGLNSGKEDQHS